MNHTIDKDTNGNGDMDDVGRLIRHVGPREEVPALRIERSRERVRGHWEQVVRERQASVRRPRLVQFARAAGVVAVTGAALLLVSRWPAPAVTGVASVERIVGELRVDGQPVSAGSAIASGASISTGPGARAALRLSAGQALRLDTGSTIVLHASDRLSLDTGALYVDTAGARQGGTIQVETPLGTARDIGTQFQVRLASATMIVGVRDGLVEVGQPGRMARAVDAGRQVAFNADGGEDSEKLDTEDPSWRWIENVAPAFDIDGASLADYLAWYANEDGLELVWADESSRSRARRTTLTGGIEGVTPSESLEVVRRVAPFEYRREQGRIWVRVE